MTLHATEQLRIPHDAALPGLSEAAQPDSILTICRERLLDVDVATREAWTQCAATEAVYQPGRSCRIAYELRAESDERPTIVYARWPASDDGHASALHVLTANGEFDLFRFPRDRRLRQIRDMRRDDWLFDSSRAWFESRHPGSVLLRDGWRCTPVKYVPESRLVCRLKGRLRSPSGEERWLRAYVRISRRDHCVAQARRLAALSSAFNEAGVPLSVPGVLGILPEHNLLATDFIRGRSLRDALRDGDDAAVTEACGRLADLSRCTPLVEWPVEERSCLEPSPMLRDLLAAAPELAVHTHPLLAWCRTPIPQPGQAGLVHGDLHAGQVIEKHQRLFVVDWDCASRGDATRDICNLASDIEFLCRGRGADVAFDLAGRAAAEWRRANGAWNDSAAAWWFAHACLLRAWGLLRHLRYDWPEAAGWLLQRAADAVQKGRIYD